MTHTLHRKGDLESLREDFVILTMSAKTVNDKGSAQKMRQFFEILEKYEPVNYGDMKTGNILNTDRDTIYNGIQDRSIVHFVFTDTAVVEKVLDEVERAGLGTSVVVSGLVEATDQLCRQVGLNMNTVEFSGGIYGKVDLLPETSILEITTMCGHGMVAANLVKEMINQIRKGKKTLQEAAFELSRPCQCGIFNPERTEALLMKFFS